MVEMRINSVRLRMEIARANTTHTRLAERMGRHRNTIRNILNTGKTDLETVGELTLALNEALIDEGQSQISPYDLLKASGFRVDIPIHEPA